MRKLLAPVALAALLVLVVAAAAADPVLRLISQDATTVTLGWDPVSGADGFRFSSSASSKRSHTWDGARTTVRFAKTDSYLVERIDTSIVGVYPGPPDPPPPPPPPADGANVWVDANGGTCSRAAAAGVYVDAAACSSFAAAYTAASSGDTVGVTGSLGIQKFAGGYQSTQGPGTKTLTFRGTLTNPGPAKSQVYTNSVRQIHFGSPNLTFDGINANAGGTRTTSAVFENGGAPFTFKNGAIGNVIDEKGALVTDAGIVFDNAYFHDVQIVTDGVHLECIWAGVPEGMTIRNSRFENCDVMDLFFVYPDYWTPLPAPYGNVTLEGNYFGSPPFGYSVYIGKNGVSLSNQTPMSGWRIRNNYFDTGSYGVNNDQPVGSNNIFCGNSGHAGLPTSWKVAC